MRPAGEASGRPAAVRPSLWALLAVAALARPAPAGDLTAAWHPAVLRPGGVAWVEVQGVPDGARVEGTVDGRPLYFFPHAGGRAALVGFDLDARPGPRRWRIDAVSGGNAVWTVQGGLLVADRRFPVERLTLPPAMVDLDPETERRALAEADRLRVLSRTITPERLWRHPFAPPLPGAGPGTGFGARRVINGQPRAPHSGADYAAPRGTPVLAANDGRVALVGDFFFPGRLVVLDHGLGLYTLYFHLEEVGVQPEALVHRGEPIGTVGSTGRATGPHLHFGAFAGGARIDPAALLGLAILEERGTLRTPGPPRRETPGVRTR